MLVCGVCGVYDCVRMVPEFFECIELTNTPFMVEIVTEILQRLRQQGRALSEIKSQLAITLDEETAEKAWALLRNKHFLEDLKEIQDVLDVGSDRTTRGEWTRKFRELAQLISNPAQIASSPSSSATTTSMQESAIYPAVFKSLGFLHKTEVRAQLVEREVTH